MVGVLVGKKKSERSWLHILDLTLKLIKSGMAKVLVSCIHLIGATCSFYKEQISISPNYTSIFCFFKYYIHFFGRGC